MGAAWSPLILQLDELGPGGTSTLFALLTPWTASTTCLKLQQSSKLQPPLLPCRVAVLHRQLQAPAERSQEAPLKLLSVDLSFCLKVANKGSNRDVLPSYTAFEALYTEVWT